MKKAAQVMQVDVWTLKSLLLEHILGFYMNLLKNVQTFDVVILLLEFLSQKIVRDWKRRGKDMLVEWPHNSGQQVRRAKRDIQSTGG